jgi:hypothetical protein
MRYLAVSEMPRRSLWDSVRRGHRKLQWHAVADTAPKPIKTLCGMSYASEAHRTWDQTMPAARCPQCHRLVMAAPGKGATFIAEAATAPKSASHRDPVAIRRPRTPSVTPGK